MASVNLSNIVVTKAKFRYSISEIVDDFLKKKLDKDVREYAKNELGIDYVYKSYDFSKIDFDKGNFESVLVAFQERDRRYGGVNDMASLED